MKTGTKIALLVGGLVVVGGGIAFAMSRSKKNATPVRRDMENPTPKQEPEPQAEVKKKKKGKIIPILGGLVVAGGTYAALKKKNKTNKGEPFMTTDDTTIDDNGLFGYI